MFGPVSFNASEHELVPCSFIEEARTLFDAQDLIVYLHRKHKNFLVAYWLPGQRGARFRDLFFVGPSLDGLSREHMGMFHFYARRFQPDRIDCLRYERRVRKGEFIEMQEHNDELRDRRRALARRYPHVPAFQKLAPKD